MEGKKEIGIKTAMHLYGSECEGNILGNLKIRTEKIQSNQRGWLLIDCSHLHLILKVEVKVKCSNNEL